MLDPRIDGWYRASGPKATFGFRVEDGVVVETAPYGRKLIQGLQWGEATRKLEQSGFEIRRPSEPNRAMRFGYLLSEIELAAKAILAGREHDIPAAMLLMEHNVREATGIAFVVSAEALDNV